MCNATCLSQMSVFFIFPNLNSWNCCLCQVVLKPMCLSKINMFSNSTLYPATWLIAWYLFSFTVLLLNMQRMERDFRFFTMELGRNMSLIMITSLMSSTLRMEANELQQFLCICKPFFSFHKLVWHCALWWNCIPTWQLPVFAPYEGLTLKKAARPYFLLLRPTLVLCHGGMIYPNVLERVYQWNQKWAMLCCFGAWGQMPH